MDLALIGALSAFIFVGLLFAFIWLLKIGTNAAPVGQADTATGARAGQQQQRPVARRAVAARNVRNRRAAARQEDSDVSDSENSQQQQQNNEEEIEEAADKLFDTKLGAKKRAKIEAKAEKKAQRESEQREREERKKREAALEAIRTMEAESKQAEEERKLEAERRALEEKERREHEEYLALKASFQVESEGFDEADTEGEENSLKAFVQHITDSKVVVLEDLAAKFKLKTQNVIDRITKLQEDGVLTGVIDDRGKFIFVSRKELEGVAKFIKQRGRVSIADLAAASNSLVNLTPVQPAA